MDELIKDTCSCGFPDCPICEANESERIMEIARLKALSYKNEYGLMKNARIFCTLTDLQEGEAWSDTYDELPIKMGEFAASNAVKKYWFKEFYEEFRKLYYKGRDDEYEEIDTQKKIFPDVEFKEWYENKVKNL